jgi:hypothetical protein
MLIELDVYFSIDASLLLQTRRTAHSLPRRRVILNAHHCVVGRCGCERLERGACVAAYIPHGNRLSPKLKDPHSKVSYNETVCANGGREIKYRYIN